MSWAKIGRSAVADEKNVAKKSSNMVERINGCEKTKRKPSIAAFTLSSPRSCTGASITSRIRRIAAMTARNETALSA